MSQPFGSLYSMSITKNVFGKNPIWKLNSKSWQHSRKSVPKATTLFITLILKFAFAAYCGTFTDLIPPRMGAYDPD